MTMTATISEKIPKIATVKTVMVKMGNDEVLFTQVKNNDAKAFEHLFKTYYASLSHYACAYVHDQDEAEEIVQDIFVKIWEKKEEITIVTSLKSYLYQAVKNKCLNYIRNKKTQHTHLTIIDRPEFENPQTIGEINASELNDKLYEALEELPPKCKQIFQMSRLDGMKHKEIADKLELKVKTIENQIGIALKILRSHLTEFLHSLVFLLINLF
jgi:RNA polymerase sigma-70 factor, ECF subfamily